MKEYQEPVIEVIEFEMEEIMTELITESMDLGEWADLEEEVGG